MIFPDYHLHSSFSEDCEASIESMMEAAKQKGLQSCCITDHYDMDFPIIPQEPNIRFDLDIEKYYSYMSSVRQKYRNKLDLRIGVELGVMPSTANRLNDYVNKHPELDFIIASLHVIDGLDPYYPDYFSEKTDFEGYKHYFETLVECIKIFHNFNVCGHLDYIVRCGKEKEHTYIPSDFADIFKELFEIIVSSGKGIEINTGSLYKNMSFPHPHRDILRLYKEAGGEIITIGSDAHNPDKIAYGFDVAKELLLAEGFQYYCTFDKQKETFHKIQ